MYDMLYLNTFSVVLILYVFCNEASLFSRKREREEASSWPEDRESIINNED